MFFGGIKIAPDVTLEDESKCGVCKERVSAFAKCIDCSQLLCDMCVNAHQRVSLTSLHRISRIASSITPPSESPQYFQNFQINENCPICDVQPQFYCQNCLARVCRHCLIRQHNGHDVMYLESATENARITNAKLLQETRATMINLREIMNQVKFMSDNVERKSLETCRAVRNSIKSSICTLEAREMELLRRIDQNRQIKGKLLLNQLESLRIALAKLSHMADQLTNSAQLNDPFEIMAVNDRAITELKQIRALRADILPCEDEGIMFLPPDKGFLRAISSYGNLNLGNSMHVPMHKPKPLPMMDPQLVINVPRDPVDHFKFAMRNRPIWNVDRVRVKDNGPRPSLMFGVEGCDDGKFCRPWGVACDQNGNIIVVDRSNNRIQVFNCKGHFISKFGVKGSGPGQFERPAGIAVNPHGHVVVADKDNHRVQVLKIDGTFILTFGERGNRNGQFNYPWDVACNYAGQILVSDTRNHRVQLFTPDGVFLSKFGHETISNMWKHFDSPRGVCFTPQGNILITDFNNHRLVLLDPTLTLINYLGQEGDNPRQFLRPQGIVCDDDGNIIVADSRNGRIQVFASNGHFLWKVGRLGKGPGEMDRPSGICLNPEGRIVVLDFGNTRVQVF